MKHKIRNYLVFVPAGYRLLWFFLELIVSVGIQVFFGAGNYIQTVYLVVLLFIFGEVLFDYWMFGGLAAKNGLQLEYLKTSSRGMQMLETALRGHMIEQLVVEFLLVAGNTSFFLWREGNLSLEGEYAIGCQALEALGYFLLVAGTDVSRFFDGLMVNMGVNITAIILMLAISVLIWRYPIGMYGLILALVISAGYISIKITMKRVKEGYYDGTD